MTQDEIRKKMAEVAEFRMPKLTPSDIKISKQKARGRGRPSREEQYQEEHEEVFLDLFEGINPTHPPELVKLHIQPVDCEDCGQHCAEGRQMEIKFYKAVARHVAHRRDRCLACNRYRDPNTGEFTLPQGPACQVYLNWAKAEYSKRNKSAKQEVKPAPPSDDHCVITYYPENPHQL